MPFFSIPMQGSWSSSVKVADKLTECTFSAKTRPYRRTQGLTLLTILIKSSGGDRGQADEVRRPTRDRITGHVVADLKAYMKSEVKPKPRYLCELLNLVSVLRLHGADSADQWTELVESLRKVRDFLPTNRHFR